MVNHTHNSDRPVFGNIIGKYQIVIPPEQREYVWDESDVRALLEDILEAFQCRENEKLDMVEDADEEEVEDGIEEELYIGAVIGLVTSKRYHSELSLYDGQQRITTLLILMNALSLALVDREYEENELLKSLRSKFIKDRRIPTSSGKRPDEPVIKPYYDYESEFFKNLKDGRVEDYRVKKSDKNITSKLEKSFRVCEKFISESFEEDDDSSQRILCLMEFISEFVEITLVIRHDAESARKVFLSLNSTGKSLENIDLMRSYLVGDANNTEENRAYIIATWGKIFKNFKGNAKQYQDFVTCFANTIRSVEVLPNHKARKDEIRYSEIYKACLSITSHIVGNSSVSIYKTSVDCIDDMEDVFNTYWRVNHGLYPTGSEGPSGVTLYSLVCNGTRSKGGLSISTPSLIAQVSLICCLTRNFPKHANLLTDLVARAIIIYRTHLQTGARNGALSRSAPFNAIFHKIRNDVLTGRSDIHRVVNDLINIKHAGKILTEDCIDSIDPPDSPIPVDRLNPSMKRSLIKLLYVSVERARGKELLDIPKGYQVEHITPQNRRDTFGQDFGNLILLESGLNGAASDKKLHDKLTFYGQSDLFLTKIIRPHFIDFAREEGILTPYEDAIASLYEECLDRHDAHISGHMSDSSLWDKRNIAARSEFYMLLMKKIFLDIKEKAIAAR